MSRTPSDDDRAALVWCRIVYHDPTSSRAQVAAAWNCAQALHAEHIRNNPWGLARAAADHEMRRDGRGLRVS